MLKVYKKLGPMLMKMRKGGYETQYEGISAVFFNLSWFASPFKTGVSNSFSYAGHILTKKGSRAALRRKMSPRATM